MPDIHVRLRDGTRICASMWMWRPKLGWFTLAGEAGGQIMLTDVVEATCEVRTPAGGVEVVDLLDRARREGWNEAR